MSEQLGYRSFAVKAAKDGEASPRGILTTEQPVEMFDWGTGEYVPEVLLMSGMKARGKSIKLLDTHNTDSVRNVLGSFVNLKTHPAGERDVPHAFVDGEIKISSTEADIATKVDEGHINEMSVGYRYSEDKTIRVPEGETVEINGKEYPGGTVIRTEWHAQEASLVPLGADDQAQIRGFKDVADARAKISRISRKQTEEESTDEGMKPDAVDGDDKPTAETEESKALDTQLKHQPKPNKSRSMENNDIENGKVEEQARQAGIKAGAEAFDKRADAIMAIGEQVEDANWAISQLRSGASVEDVQAAAIKKLKEANASLGTTPEPLGLSKKESKSYSVTTAMRQLISGKGLDGIEGEVSDAIAKRCGRETNGFFLPSKRDLVAGTATDGAELVGTDTRGGDFIDALRPNMVTMQAGVRVLNGLTSDVSIPRKSSASAATFKAEVTAHANTEPQFESVSLSPRHLGTYTDVSKQLLAQGSPDVDALIRDDLNQAVAVALDKAVIQGAGSGSNEPQGIIGATGVSSVAIADNSGGEPTTAELHTFLKELDDDNALRDNSAWITGSVIASAMKQTLLTSAVSGYQWDMSNNTVLGQRAFSTSQIPAERTILGDLSEYILGIWDGTEIVYDPFSGAKTRTVTFVLNLMCDGNVRQPKAFAVSDDGS